MFKLRFKRLEFFGQLSRIQSVLISLLVLFWLMGLQQLELLGIFVNFGGNEFILEGYLIFFPILIEVKVIIYFWLLFILICKLTHINFNFDWAYLKPIFFLLNISKLDSNMRIVLFDNIYVRKSLWNPCLFVRNYLLR